MSENGLSDTSTAKGKRGRKPASQAPDAPPPPDIPMGTTEGLTQGSPPPLRISDRAQIEDGDEGDEMDAAALARKEALLSQVGDPEDDAPPMGAGAPEASRAAAAAFTETPIDTRFTERARRRGEPPIGAAEGEIDELARSLARLGTHIRIRVTRLYPEGIPATEVGPFPWIQIPGQRPTPEQVRNVLENRFGGGRYRIQIADVNEEAIEEAKEITQDVGGEPIFQTTMGRTWYQTQTGTTPIMPRGPDGAPTASAASLMDSGINGVLAMLLDAQTKAAERAEKARAEKDHNEVSLATALIQSQANRPNPLAGLLPFAPILLEFYRDMKSSRDRKEDKLEKMLEKLSEAGQAKPTDPMASAALYEPVVRLQEKMMAARLDAYVKESSMLRDRLADQLGAGDDPTLKGAFVDMLKTAGPDVMRSLAPMLAGLANRGAAQAQAAQAGQARPAPRPALRPGAVAVGPVQGPAPSGPTQAPSGQRMVSTVPPPGSPPPPPDVDGAPPRVGPVEAAGAPEALPELPEARETPDAPPPPAQRLTPAQNAQRLALMALENWLYHVATFAHVCAVPEDAWDAVIDGQSMTVWFGMCPPVFRENVEKADVGEPFSVAAWADGAPEPILEIARGIDELISQSGESRKFLCDFIDCGPWTDDEPEDPV